MDTSEPIAMSRDPRPSKPKGLRLELEEADVQRLRVVAAQAGLSMASYLRRIVLADLDAKAPKEGPKGKGKSQTR